MRISIQMDLDFVRQIILVKLFAILFRMVRTINFNNTYYVLAHGKITECKIEEITLCVGKIVKHKDKLDISKALQKMIVKLPLGEMYIINKDYPSTMRNVTIFNSITDLTKGDAKKAVVCYDAIKDKLSMKLSKEYIKSIINLPFTTTAFEWYYCNRNWVTRFLFSKKEKLMSYKWDEHHNKPILTNYLTKRTYIKLRELTTTFGVCPKEFYDTSHFCLSEHIAEVENKLEVVRFSSFN